MRTACIMSGKTEFSSANKSENPYTSRNVLPIFENKIVDVSIS